MKINTYASQQILRNWSFLSEFDTLLMYINLHTRSHIYLKISIFCKKMITFSSSAHLMEKSTFLPKFQFVSHKIDIFAPKLILTETLVTLPQRLHDIILRNSFVCPKTDAFCINYYFLLKENNSSKNWHFSKTEDTSLRKSNISI